MKSAKAIGNLEVEVESQIIEAKALFMCGEMDVGKKILKKLRQRIKKKEELQACIEKLDPLLIAAVRICRTQDILFVTEDQDKAKLIRLHEILGDNYSTLANYETAIVHYKKCCELAEAVGVGEKKVSRLYFSIAETYRDLQNYNSAYKYYLKELSMHRENIVEEFKTQTNITLVLEKLCKPHEVVIEAHKKAISMAKSMENYSRLLTALNNYALYLKNIKNHDEHKKQVEVMKKIKNEHNVSDSEEPETDSQDLLDEESDIDLDNLSAEESDDEIDEEKGKKPIQVRSNEAGESQLHLAAKKGDLKAVRRLIRQNHPVNVTDNAKWTPLHEASNYGHAEVVEELLKHGADVNAAGGVNDDGKSEKVTPLHDAASNCHTETMKILLKNKANVLSKDREGRYPIDSLVSWRASDGSNCAEQELVAYRELKQLLMSHMEKAGRPYRIQDEKRARKNTTRASSPKMSLLVSKPQDYDCPIPVKIATDDFDPDQEGCGKKLYERAMKQVRRKDNEEGNSKEKPRPISPGPRCGLIPSELDVHDDWLLPDDAAMPEMQSRVFKSHQSTSSKPKRKRNPVDDDDESYDRSTRRKTSAGSSRQYNGRSRKSSGTKSPTMSSNSNDSVIANSVVEDGSELLDIEMEGDDHDPNQTATASRKGRNINIHQAIPGTPDAILDDPMLSDDDEFNSIVFSNDFEKSLGQDDFLPSQMPARSPVEFGRTVDVEVVDNSDDREDERSSSPPPSIRSTSSRSRPRPIVSLSSDDDDDENEFQNSARSKYSTNTHGVKLSELASVFKQTKARSDAKENRKSVQSRLPYKSISKPSRNSDVAGRSSTNEHANSIRRTLSSSSLANGRTSDEHHKQQEVLRLKIRILDNVLLVPVDENHRDETIEWLATESASRYRRAYGVKPILTLQTKDGATLSSSDPISLVLGTNERELVGVVSDFDLPPLIERYAAACSDVAFEPDSEVKSSLNSCQSSNILYLKDVNLRGRAGVIVMNALQRQYSLRILELSGCSLFDSGLFELCKILPTLPGLTDLDLSSNGITKTGILSFAEAFQQKVSAGSTSSCSKMPIGLTSLVLSHNPLGNFVGHSLATLISKLSSLKVLKVADCDFNEKLFSWSKNELTNALNNSRLEELDISYNNWKDVGIEKCLNSLPARRIRILNCSSCILSSNPNENNDDAIAKAISSFFSRNEDCCNLTKLQLSGCCLSDKSMELILDNFDRLVRLESLELSRNDRLSSQSLINVLCRSVEQNIPLTKLDMGSIPDLLNNPRVTQEMILNALEKKMGAEKKLTFLRLPRSGIETPASTDNHPSFSKLESKMIELMEDYAGNMRFHYEKESACIIYRFES
ncbi:Tonsoku-like protein [Orchesella cincta]|uniref:Tonsoku-like protein n=1 Tax=Orchesella cincta TaxID=48709 RepID=A0A1D2NJ43_ORCCI|nr:Tonsoku-like protein [Orchesella cincta]